MTDGLSIDFGTSTTVAVVRRPDGRTRPLLFDGSPLLTSAVLLGPDGSLHTGRDAAHLARSFPDRLEPNPKRRIDEGMVLLGDREIDVRELFAAVLRRVAAEADRVGVGTGDVVLTHPVTWSRHRQAVLIDAAVRAGLSSPRLIAEPVAAATYFARMETDGQNAQHGQVDRDGPVLVYDLGAGTCDVSLLRPAPAVTGGFEVIASAGLDDVGGLDVDAAIVGALQDAHGPLWTDADSRRQLWDEVRTAKEMLSRASGTIIRLPALGYQVPLGRPEFDELARSVLAPTMELVTKLVASAGRSGAAPVTLYLVGGSSRIPLVATMLHTALGIGPVVTEQPELVVAEGALNPQPREAGAPSAAADPAGRASPDSPPPPLGPPLPHAPPVPVPARNTRDAGDRLVTGVVVGVVLVLLVGFVTGGLLIRSLIDNRDPADRGGTVPEGPSGRSSTSSPLSGASTSPDPSAPESNTTAIAALYRFADYGAICERIDLAETRKIFEKLDREPASSRVPGSLGIASCFVALSHVAGSEPDSRANIDVRIWIYDHHADAKQKYAEDLENAEINKDDPVTVTGLGDEAFTHRKFVAVPGTSSDIELTLQVRHVNLLFTASIMANRLDGWSKSARDRIEAAFLASAKATYARLAIK